MNDGRERLQTEVSVFCDQYCRYPREPVGEEAVATYHNSRPVGGSDEEAVAPYPYSRPAGGLNDAEETEKILERHCDACARVELINAAMAHGRALDPETAALDLETAAWEARERAILEHALTHRWSPCRVCVGKLCEGKDGWKWKRQCKDAGHTFFRVDASVIIE